MNLVPLSNCVLIEQDIEKSSGLIVLPESKMSSGVVVAVGAGLRKEDGSLVPMDLAVGDHVLFGEFSGQKVKHDGKEYLMMREPDVIGVLNG
jgi:chaperonin GroES